MVSFEAFDRAGRCLLAAFAINAVDIGRGCVSMVDAWVAFHSEELGILVGEL